MSTFGVEALARLGGIEDTRRSQTEATLVPKRLISSIRCAEITWAIPSSHEPRKRSKTLARRNQLRIIRTRGAGNLVSDTTLTATSVHQDQRRSVPRPHCLS